MNKLSQTRLIRLGFAGTTKYKLTISDIDFEVDEFIIKKVSLHDNDVAVNRDEVMVMTSSLYNNMPIYSWSSDTINASYNINDICNISFKTNKKAINGLQLFNIYNLDLDEIGNPSTVSLKITFVIEFIKYL